MQLKLDASAFSFADTSIRDELFSPAETSLVSVPTQTCCWRLQKPLLPALVFLVGKKGNNDCFVPLRAVVSKKEKIGKFLFFGR